MFCLGEPLLCCRAFSVEAVEWARESLESFAVIAVRFTPGAGSYHPRGALVTQGGCSLLTTAGAPGAEVKGQMPG